MPAAAAAQRPWVVAHRGASADCPENTLAAFDEALRQGCDGIELDLQLSRDGVPVVYHDRTLRKAGGGRRRVETRTLEELRRLDVGVWFSPDFRGQRIPTLDEVIERYARQTRLLLEIKLRGRRETHERLLRAVLDILRRRRVEAGVLVLCFDLELLAQSARLTPQVPRVLNLKPRGARLPASPDRLGALWALSADVRGLTPAFGTAARELGLRLLTYTCNTERRVARSLEAGAIGVMTDRPGWLAPLLAARAGTAARR